MVWPDEADNICAWLNKWWWNSNADKVPWFRAASTSGRCPIYRQRKSPGMLGSWAGQDMGRRLISYWGPKDVDLPLKARRRTTTLPKRMGRGARSGGPLFHSTGKYQRAQDDYQMERVAAARCGWRKMQRVVFPRNGSANRNRNELECVANVPLGCRVFCCDRSCIGG
jgi:hypothetical protein